MLSFRASSRLRKLPENHFAVLAQGEYQGGYHADALCAKKEHQLVLQITIVSGILQDIQDFLGHLLRGDWIGKACQNTQVSLKPVSVNVTGSEILLGDGRSQNIGL